MESSNTKSSSPANATSKPVESKSTTETPAKASTSTVIDDAPDPDEDDLDDLDDMLDEFSPSKPEVTSKPAPASAAKVQDIPDDITDDDFAKQLQAGMAEMLGGFDKDPAMKAQFDAMMKELGGMEGLGELAGGLGASPQDSKTKSSTSKAATSSKPSTSTATAKGDESFQDTIKKTMERMQASGDKATAAAAEDDGADMLAELMKQMGAGALGGEGGDEDFSKMLLGMMEQLTNKEILYEPMKELDDKFPQWIKANMDTTPEEDMIRYKEQQKVVSEIVKKFEEKTYKDENTADRQYIVDRMQRVCV